MHKNKITKVVHTKTSEAKQMLCGTNTPKFKQLLN